MFTGYDYFVEVASFSGIIAMPSGECDGAIPSGDCGSDIGAKPRGEVGISTSSAELLGDNFDRAGSLCLPDLIPPDTIILSYGSNFASLEIVS